LVKGYNICCHYGNGDEVNTKYKRDRIKVYSAPSDVTIALPEDCAVYVEKETITFLGSGIMMFITDYTCARSENNDKINYKVRITRVP